MKPTFKQRLLLGSISLALAAPSAFGVTDTYNTAGTFTWVCPAGVTSVQVECWGGGGAGGAGRKDTSAGTNTSQNGGGGGGGAYARKATVPVTPGNPYTVTIPAAAVSGTNGTTTNGGGIVSGGNVTFVGESSVTVTASGGTGGKCAYTTVNGTTAAGAGAGGTTASSVGDVGGIFAGGAGGTATTGSTNYSGGGGGGAGNATAGGAASATTEAAGAGGTAGGGAGGAGRGGGNTNPGVGANGTTPGGAGGGGHNQGISTQLGGTGGRGQILLTYTLPPSNFKANNTDNLNLASSWTSAFVPIGATAEWNNTVTSANTTVLGADLTFSGIKVSNPGGLVTINSGNTLTLGAAAIDLDLSAATQDLTLNCNLAMGAANVWDVASARTATLGGAVSGAFSVTKQGLGAAILSGPNTYSGATTVSSGTLTLASTGSLTTAGNILLSVSGAGAVANINGTYTSTGGGGVAINSGGILNTSGNVSISGANNQALLLGTAGGSGTWNVTGGSVLVNYTGNGWGISNGGDGALNVSGGSVTTVGADTFQVGFLAGGTGTLKISGTGLVTISPGAGSFSIGRVLNATGIVNLDGGTLAMGRNISKFSTATGTFNFNNGLLQAGLDSTTYMTGLTAANVRNGGAKIDTNGFKITIGQALLHSSISGDAATDGGLIKSGLGALTLSGANTYNGGTAVSGGALKFTTGVASTTNVSVADGAEAGASVAVNDGQWVNTGNLTLANNGAVVIDYGSTTPSTTVAPISVTNFAIGTNPGVRLVANPSSAILVGQTYPLVTWTGSGPADGSAFTNRLMPRIAGTFSVSSNTLFMTVTGNASGSPISWNTGDGTWDTTTVNWLDGNLAATTYFDTFDAVIFDDATGASGNPVVTLNSAFSPLGVTMKSTSHDYTISGSGAIGGTGSLTLDATNARTLTLSTANNAFSGGTIINGGSLVLGHASNTLLDSGAVTVDGATAILSLGANSDTVGAVSLKNGAFITGSGGTLTGAAYAVESGSITANLGGSGILTKTTAGIVTLSGNNSTATGASSIGGGTLVAAHVSALNPTGLVAISAATGSGTLRLATDTSVNAFPLTSSSSFQGTIISDRATAGAGITHVLGAAALGGNIWNFQAGSNVTSGTAAISLASVNVTAGSASTCTLNPTLVNVSIPGAVNIGTNNFAKTLALDGTSTGNTISGVISNGLNTLTLTKTNSSTWTLTGVNTYTGSTTISGGTLQLGDGTNGNDGTIASSSSIINNAALIYNRFGTLSSSVPISGTGTVTKLGAGTQTLASANTYTGTTTISTGILKIGNATALGAQTGSTDGTTISSGATLDLAGIATGVVAERLTASGTGVGGNGAIISSAQIASPFIGVRYLTLAGNTTLGFANRWDVGSNTAPGISALAGNGFTLNLLGTAAAAQASLNNLGATDLGDINVNLGAVAATNIFYLQGDTTLGRPANTITITGGTTIDVFTSGTLTSYDKKFALDNGIIKIDKTGAMSLPGTIILTNSNTINANGATVAITASNVISGTGSLTKVGTGSLTLTNVNIYNGSTTISAGTLQLGDGTTGNDGTIANSLSLVNNAALVYNRFGTVSYGGVISGTGTVTKSGAGTQTLTGANTYTGTTTVSAGTLQVNSPGSLAAGSAVAVNGTSTLGGNGTIGGSVTVAAAANLSPGATVGTLTITGSLNIAAQAGGAGILAYELNSLAGTNDKIVAGSLTIGSGVLGMNDFAFTNLGGLQAGTYKLITSGVPITGTLDAANLTGTIGAFNVSLQIDGTGKDLELVVTSANGYDAWATLKGLTGAPGSATDPAKSADPDNDGTNNLAEFAFNGDPLSGSNNGLHALLLQDTVAPTGNELTYIVAVRDGVTFATSGLNQTNTTAVDGLFYTVQGSLDLAFPGSQVSHVGAASNTAPAATGLPDLTGTDWEYHTFRLDASEGLTDKGFLRAKVSE